MVLIIDNQLYYSNLVLVSRIGSGGRSVIINKDLTGHGTTRNKKIFLAVVQSTNTLWVTYLQLKAQ
jgi:hypothetical protein